MIRVLHITGGLTQIGGTPRKLSYLAKYSNQARIQHFVLCTFADDLLSEYENAGVKVWPIKSESPLILMYEALRIARQIKVHVIATHFTRQFICGTLVARLLKLPLIHHEHGPATIDRSSSSPVKVFGRALKRRCLPLAEGVIANSKYTAATVMSSFGVDAKKFRVVYNPVEPRSEPAPIHAADDLEDKDASKEVLIGHIGGMTEWRDQATLLKALRLLINRSWNARLILIGEGPQRASLEKLTAELKLQAYVKFTGYQTDLRSFFSTIDVYVNPAVAEGFGIAVAEAMLAGKPVVLADAGAHPELVTEGVTGTLYRARDEQSLANQLAALLSNPSRMKRLAQAGRLHAQQSFSPQRYAETYQQVVEQLVSIKRNPTSSIAQSESL